MLPVEIGLYEKAMPNTLSLKEKLEQAKKSGYDYMELSIDETDEKLSRLDWSEGQRFALIREMYRTAMPVKTMCLSGHRKYPLGSEDPAIADKSLEIMKKALKLASDLGIRIIQLAGYDEYYNESNSRTRENFIKNLAKCVEMAASCNVMLGFETMETPFMDTCTKAMEYVNMASSPYLGVYPDIGNLTNASAQYDFSIQDDLAQAAGHIFAVHLKETRPGQYREVPFGTGHVNFTKLIKRALMLGVRSFTLEFWHTGSDWERQLYDNRRFIEDKFRSAMQ